MCKNSHIEMTCIINHFLGKSLHVNPIDLQKYDCEDKLNKSLVQFQTRKVKK